MYALRCTLLLDDALCDNENDEFKAECQSYQYRCGFLVLMITRRISQYKNWIFTFYLHVNTKFSASVCVCARGGFLIQDYSGMPLNARVYNSRLGCIHAPVLGCLAC